MIDRNDTDGLSKYVVATIIFFVGIAFWVGFIFVFGLPLWVYIFAVVFGVVMAAAAVWYLSPKEDW